MKRILTGALIATLWAVAACAQDTSTDDLKLRLAKLEKENADLKAQIAAVQQRPMLSEAEQAARLKEGYIQACKRQGLKFKELIIETSTGKASIVCGQ